MARTKAAATTLKRQSAKPSVPKKILLWQQDGALAGQRKAEARRLLNARIRRTVQTYAGPPPRKPSKPHHLNHEITEPELSVGHNNYRLIGSYFVRCKDSKSAACVKKTLYLTEPFPEAFLLKDDVIARDLFMREELRAIPKASTVQRTPAPITIADSDLYAAAYQKYYGPPEVIPAKDEDQEPGCGNNNDEGGNEEDNDGYDAGYSNGYDEGDNGYDKGINEFIDNDDGDDNDDDQDMVVDVCVQLPSPPPTNSRTAQPRAGPSCRRTILDLPLDSDSEPTAPSTPTAAGPRSFPAPPTAVAAATEDVDLVIEISDDEEEVQESDGLKVPFLFVLWVEDGTRFTEILLSATQHQRFNLSSFRLEFGARGIELDRRLEVFNPSDGSWNALPWSSPVGPITSPGKAFLFRYEGVRSLNAFDVAHMLAAPLPGQKGKSRG